MTLEMMAMAGVSVNAMYYEAREREALNVATVLNIVDEAQFPHVAAWKTKVQARPAYLRMLKAARPDGMIGSLPKLERHAPSGPR